jgi:hypothetical protein
MGNNILINTPENYVPAEDYTFALGADGKAYETIMTPEEFEIIRAVIKRAYKKLI